jgi:hypothetical protein
LKFNRNDLIQKWATGLRRESNWAERFEKMESSPTAFHSRGPADMGVLAVSDFLPPKRYALTWPVGLDRGSTVQLRRLHCREGCAGAAEVGGRRHAGAPVRGGADARRGCRGRGIYW